MSRRLYIAELLFLYIEGKDLVVHDYGRHVEYYLERPYLNALLDIARHGKTRATAICAELMDAGLVVKKRPAARRWGWDIVSKIFHLGTQTPYPVVDRNAWVEMWLEERERLRATTSPAEFAPAKGRTVTLPSPRDEATRGSSLHDAIHARRTVRDFTGASISRQELSDLLFASFGLIHDPSSEMTGSPRRAYASGGNLHGEEVYVVAYRVDDLAPGLYHYRPSTHRLGELRRGDLEEEVIQLNGSQYFSEGMAFGVYLTVRFARIWWKYPAFSRGYRVLLLDAGHASHNFQLVCTANGLRTWVTAAFDEVRVNRFLGLAELEENALLFLGAGRSGDKTYSDEYVQADQRRQRARR